MGNYSQNSLSENEAYNLLKQTIHKNDILKILLLMVQFSHGRFYTALCILQAVTIQGTLKYYLLFTYPPSKKRWNIPFLQFKSCCCTAFSQHFLEIHFTVQSLDTVKIYKYVKYLWFSHALGLLHIPVMGPLNSRAAIPQI